MSIDEADSIFWRPLEDLGLEISDHGAIRTLTLPHRRLKAGFSSGYMRVKLNGKQHYVHVLVARAWLGPRPHGKVVRHKNGVFDDNRVDNLEYADRTAATYSMDTFLRRW